MKKFDYYLQLCIHYIYLTLLSYNYNMCKVFIQCYELIKFDNYLNVKDDIAHSVPSVFATVYSLQYLKYFYLQIYPSRK